MILHSATRLLGAAFLTLGLGTPAATLAQQVIFPQERQAGTARLAHSANHYTLSNDLLTATFMESEGTLRFGGCPQLNLNAGSELFEIRMGNGSTVVRASEMKLSNVREIHYAANPSATKGAEKLPGHAIEATFTHNHLTVLWRAVLRDGSHYLRTELKLTAAHDTKLFAVVPMLYEMDVHNAGSAPRKVGNTRGAVLLSDKIFAGLETPMGLNTVGAGDEDELPFTHDAWKTDDFVPPTAASVPDALIKGGHPADKLAVAQGYVNFKQASSQTLTFTFKGGSHKLNLVGVDVVNLEGKVVASDYHYGTMGDAHKNNVYTLNIPKTGVYRLRYFVDTAPETINSRGEIAFSGRVSRPIIVRDLAPGSAPRLDTHTASAPSTPHTTRALSAQQMSADDALTDAWTATEWKQPSRVPSRINEVGYYDPNVKAINRSLKLSSTGTLSVQFNYSKGNTRLNLCGLELVDGTGNVVASDYHKGFTGNASEGNVYRFNVPYAGDFTLIYYAQNKDEEITSEGKIRLSLAQSDTLHLAAQATTTLRGTWSRNTTLHAGDDWKVSAVVGLVAPGQPRRSFLSYSERERAVPWRAMPAYISWYELNIDRNNDPNYTSNMHDWQCEEVVRQWKKNLFDPYHTAVNSFVWDDGWDHYGDWTFSPNFPDGFRKSDALAREMGSGIGAWLGPVGGYGQSGNYRRDFWKGKGGMQLSNPKYYETFTRSITDLCNKRGYDFRFFKFDGISAQFSAVGPDAGIVGEENAEGIIRAERMVRENIKPDIFFNTTVGTWASPFWFQYTDAVWRQEGDYGEAGNQGSDRERWITYRDALVHKNFVKNSPLCPINTLMTHGFILSTHGQVSKNMDYDGIVRELRCAFACGSGMVELYNDYALTNSIRGGRLWGDLAEAIRWQKNNADVLPDAHWVGGNPWTGTRAEVYGWASWNGQKATLALRNPAATAATFHTTLRQALEIPNYVKGSIILSKAFGRQDALKGLNEDAPIDIDAPLTLSFPASSVYVFNGRESTLPAVAVTGITLSGTEVNVAPGREKALVWDIAPVNATHTSVEWSVADPTVAKVDNGVVRGIKDGETTVTVKAEGGHTATVRVKVSTPPYAISFEGDTNQSGDRIVKKVTLTTPSQKQPTVLSLGEHPKAYTDLTATPVNVGAGSVVTIAPEWKGAWMHAYVYIDLNNDGKFDASSPDSPEVVAFTYHKGKSKGENGLSAQENNNPGMSIPAFKLPETKGTYRLRLKIDWDDLNPAGSTAAGNEILKNRGSVTDLLLNVTPPTAISAPQLAPTDASSPTYDLTGRQVLGKDNHGLIIIGGKKQMR